MIKKHKIDKFHYGNNVAKYNMYKAVKILLKVIKIYGQTILRIAIIVYLLLESALAEEKPSSCPSSSPNPIPRNQVAPAS